MAASSHDSLPIIDLSADLSVAASAVRSACLDTGFFYVKNHGISQACVDAAFAASKAFFDLPSGVKDKYLADENNRGYTPMFEETLDPERQKEKGDTKEGYYIGRHCSRTDPESALPLHGPNVWPAEADCPGYQPALTAYFDAVTSLGHKLKTVFASSLGLAPAQFDAPGMFDRPMLFLRPLHYNGEASNPDQGVFGAGAHSDYGFLTILATDDNAGLQIFDRDAQQWRDVPPRRGCFIVNVGDLLERWSNEAFRSTIHRVITKKGGRDRYSMPFFFEPNFDCSVVPVPQFVSKERPAKHGPITAGAYLLGKYEQTHANFEGGPADAKASASSSKL